MNEVVDKQESGYGETQGLRLLKEMAGQGQFIFSTADAAAVSAQVGIPQSYVRQVLSQLVKTSWVRRLRRGLYAWSGTLPGGAEVHPFAVATRVVQPSAISHWSAMSHHGFTEQVPRVVTASTPRKVVTPSMRRSPPAGRSGRHFWEIAGVRYEYVTVKPESFFGIDGIWIDQTFKVPITDPERALLDLFAHPRLFGGLGEALSVLEEHLADIDVHRLVGYGVRYGKGSVAKRLGWSLEQVGVSGGTLIPLLEIPTAGHRALDPTQPRRGPCDDRWGVQDNLGARAT